jgi:hypothetical protein
MRSKSIPRKPRGPLAKRCRTCADLHPVGALTFGQCAECAGLVALPLRGAGGRFISFSTTSEGGVR